MNKKVTYMNPYVWHLTFLVMLVFPHCDNFNFSVSLYGKWGKNRLEVVEFAF